MNIYARIPPVYFAALFALLFLSGCPGENRTSSLHEQLVDHPGWSENAAIYEVNIRQYTPEGTIEAFQEHLPRLKEMGIDILWLMPIHPIGEKNRKGELGSYYSIKDYTAVNPNFGTREDLIELVDAAHRLDMRLILDWVPNHTAWDHPWVTEHPEFYMKDSLGNITYEADWTDIAQLNYANRELWDRMIEKMKYWIEEADIDGYRVDHAGHDIPLDFWKRAIPEIDGDSEKELFWLAEWNTPEMHPWFDATYSWEYFHLTTSIAAGEEPLTALDRYMAKEDTTFPDHAYRICFTTNHDENSWNGSDPELFGANFQNFAVLAATINGMPLIYSGQETGLDERLEFFQKDTIDWDDYEYEAFYSTLTDLKERNEALWNGQYGGRFERLKAGIEESVYAFRRVKGDSEVVVAINISGDAQDMNFSNIEDGTAYRDVFTGESVSVSDGSVTLPANGYLVWEKL